MALTFPPQPQEIGTIYEGPNGVNYIWDGVKWVSSGSPGIGNAYLGNIYISDQTISGLNENDPIFITGNVEVGNLATGGFSIGENAITVTDGNLYVNGTVVGQDNTFDQSLNTTDNVAFENVSVNSAVTINSVELTADSGTLYVDGIAVGSNSSQLTNGDYTLALYPNGNILIPGTISSNATGIPEFNSTTDLNLNALNRVNITNSPLNLAKMASNTIIGKSGDLILDNNQVKTYVNGQWEILLRTDENSNVRLPINGVYQRADGVRVAWFTELPTDISQLTDTNNLLTSDTVTLQNINIDGGGAYSIYEAGLLFADGGFGSSRFGPSDTVFDGAGADSGYTNSLNGGGA